MLCGHAHKWERLSAVVGGRVERASVPRAAPGGGGAMQHGFERPRAPVYVIAGMGGADRVVNDCRRFRQAPFFLNCSVPAFSEAEGYDQGFLRVAAASATRLRLEYVASVIGPNVTAGAGAEGGEGERGGGGEGGGLAAPPVGVVIQTIVIEQDLGQAWAEEGA